MSLVEIASYDPDWIRRYKEAAQGIGDALGPSMVAIHHIGSTAVPGMVAKPVLDIMPVVQDIRDLDDIEPAIARLGYEPRGEHGIPGRRYFVKESNGRRSHHVPRRRNAD